MRPDVFIWNVVASVDLQLGEAGSRWASQPGGYPCAVFGISLRLPMPVAEVDQFREIPFGVLTHQGTGMSCSRSSMIWRGGGMTQPVATAIRSGPGGG
jgi:hypothetical protein